MRGMDFWGVAEESDVEKKMKIEDPSNCCLYDCIS